MREKKEKRLVLMEHDELCECSTVDECGYDPCAVRTPACVCDCKGIKLGREAERSKHES